MLTNVTEEGIAGPSAQEHDCVDWNMVEIHGHGSGGATGVQSDDFRGDAEAVEVNGLHVGSKELESNGTGHVFEFSRSGHVGVNE